LAWECNDLINHTTQLIYRHILSTFRKGWAKLSTFEKGGAKLSTFEKGGAKSQTVLVLPFYKR
jgi:hypothetical protein